MTAPPSLAQPLGPPAQKAHSIRPEKFPRFAGAAAATTATNSAGFELNERLVPLAGTHRPYCEKATKAIMQRNEILSWGILKKSSERMTNRSYSGS